MKENFEGLVQRLLNGGVFLEEAVELLERSMIDGALKMNHGNHSAASKQIGIHRNTLQRKVAQYGLGDGRARARRKPVKRETPARRRRTGAA